MATTQIDPQVQKPAKRPWYKKKRFVIPLAFLVFIIAINALGGGSGTQQPAGSTPAAPAPDTSADSSDATSAENQDSGQSEAADDTSMGTIGKPVRDGDFEFVVGAPKCGQKQIGDQYFNTRAQGQFCLVPVTVKNIGDAPGSMFGENQKVRDAAGREFSADTEAAIYLKDSESIFEEINPGNTLKGTIVYDVPSGIKLTEIQLHDSVFSGGVKVKL